MTKDKKKKKDIKVIIISIAIILFSIILVSFIPDGGLLTNTPETIDVNDMEDQIDLHIQAQQFVLQTLKAPSTAKFPALPYEVIDLGDGRYNIMSYVDSQNVFGAIIRSDWSVLMKLNINIWSPERIVVGGEVVYDPIQTQKNKEKAIADKKKLDQEIEKAQRMIDEAERNIKSWQ